MGGDLTAKRRFKMKKEQILQNYGRPNMREYNKSMYPNANKVKFENCELYLYPTYVRVDDKFTDEEILDNFYIGDLMEINLAIGTAKAFFGDNWDPENGYGECN